jgi:hypothetical protein
MAQDDLAEGLNRHTRTGSIGGWMPAQIVVKDFFCLELPRTYHKKIKTSGNC